MEIKIISVGKVKEKDLANRIEHYEDRIQYDCRFVSLQIKDSNVQDEGERIVQILDKEKGSFVVCCTEEGKQFTSREFAEVIGSKNVPILFIIGSAEGISETIKKRANLLLSFSKMTFTHEMARMFLVEQVYRGISILKNRKYHKD